VTPVIDENPVGWCEMLADPYSNSLLPYGEVDRTLDEVGGVEVDDSLFHQANAKAVD